MQSGFGARAGNAGAAGCTAHGAGCGAAGELPRGIGRSFGPAGRAELAAPDDWGAAAFELDFTAARVERGVAGADRIFGGNVGAAFVAASGRQARREFGECDE